MVAHFKVGAGHTPVYEITRENVEALLGRRPPWFRQGQDRGDDRHYAVCPYCDNPIQLKGLYKRREGSPRPHGSHTGGPVEGFQFNSLDLEFCPYRLKRQTHGKDARREMGPAAKQLIVTAISEFDRIVRILRDDFGFPFSDKFAREMLDQWFDSEGYLYTGAHLRNLPWMVAYFGRAQSLFGQFVGKNADLADRIGTEVPQARISDAGQLVKGSAWYSLYLQCLHHRVEIRQEDGALIESLTLRVQDFTKTNEAGKAPTIYRKEIVFDPERFEALIRTSPDRQRRDAALLEMARNIAAKRGFL